MVEKWQEKEVSHICSGIIFNYYKKTRTSPDGKKRGAFDVIECYPWVNVLAFNEKNELILEVSSIYKKATGRIQKINLYHKLLQRYSNV